MKKLLAVLVALLIVACMVPASATRLDYGLFMNVTPDMYPNTDLSEHKTVEMLLVGDTPADWEMVLGAINEELAEFNTTLHVTFLSWSDHPTMYPLLLTGGDQLDVCYCAAGWCHLWEEAGNENFYVLTEDFIEKYMPLTAQYQDPDSWMEVKLDGKIQAVAQGWCPTGPVLVAIRGDVREKYGLDKINDYASYKAYLLGVAEHTGETGLIALNCDASEGVRDQYWRGTGLEYMTTATSWRYIYKGGELPTADELTYTYKTEAYRAYLDEAKELCEAGVWSRSALNKTETTAQSFGNGTSAAMQWNYTIYQYMDLAEKIDGVYCEDYDLAPESFHTTESYNNSCLAISAASKDVERAAMIIDVLKWDYTMNMKICYGIEGYHYIDNKDGTYDVNPDHTSGYVPSCIALSWIVRNGDMSEKFTDPREKAMYDSCESRAAGNVTNGFVFNTEPVVNEKAAVDAVVSEYRNSLGLGFFDDADAAYAEFMGMMDEAGFEALDTEFRTQYAAWYDVMVG